MNLLIIEDDTTLAALMKRHFERNNVAVDIAISGTDGIYEATTQVYDCIILDINLPDMTGFEVCNSIREKQLQTPILMLTARNALEDRVTGLNLGADDYVAKPVDSVELIARVRALIRRSTKQPSPILTIGNLKINTISRLANREGHSVELNAKEFSILEYLALHADEVVTRTMIMEHVWGSDFETLSNVVDVYIRYLRSKIDQPGLKPLIHTIRGHGYILTDKR